MTENSRTTGSDKIDHDDDNSNGWWRWLFAALVVIGLVIGAFFALGGDADVDVDPGDIDIEAPDIEAPDVDVDVEAP